MSASLLIYPKGFVCSPFANWLRDKGVEIFEVDNPIVKKVLFVPEWAHRLASIRMDIAKPADDDEVDAVIEKLARLDAESRDAALTVLDLAGLRPFLAYVKGLPRPSPESWQGCVGEGKGDG